MFMPNEVVFASWPFQQVEEIYACTHTILIHVYSFIYTYAYVCVYTPTQTHVYTCKDTYFRNNRLKLIPQSFHMKVFLAFPIVYL